MGKSTDLAVPVEGAQPETLSALKKCQMPLCITQPSGVKGDMSTAVQVKPYSPHALKPIPSRVLTEDDYVGILEMIIQRDFFPDLPVYVGVCVPCLSSLSVLLFLGYQCVCELRSQSDGGTRPTTSRDSSVC